MSNVNLNMRHKLEQKWYASATDQIGSFLCTEKYEVWYMYYIDELSSARDIDPHEPLHLQGFMRNHVSC